jgi:hypothetical protein
VSGGNVGQEVQEADGIHEGADIAVLRIAGQFGDRFVRVTQRAGGRQAGSAPWSARCGRRDDAPVVAADLLDPSEGTIACDGDKAPESPASR